MATITTRDFKTALRTYVLDDSAITALIGSRLLPVRAEQNETLPYVTYATEHSTIGATHDGGDDLCESTIVFAIVGETPSIVEDIGHLITQRLHAFRGYFDEFGAHCGLSPCIPGVYIATSFFDSETDVDEVDIEAFGKDVTFEITFKLLQA